jgi:hypothetical protein
LRLTERGCALPRSTELWGSAPAVASAEISRDNTMSSDKPLVPSDQSDDDAYSQDVAVMKRVRWFSELPKFDSQYYRLLVDQKMVLDRDRRHNLGHHRGGVVEGLEILYTGTGLSFKVTPGFAIDPDGFALIRSPNPNVPPDRESNFSGSAIESGGSRYLCICPSLAKTDKLAEQGNSDYSTWWDRPRIVLVSEADLNDAQEADKTRREQLRVLEPSDLGSNGTYQSNLKAVVAYNAVILARVTRRRDDTLEFDYSERQCSGTIVPNIGASPPAALCFRPNPDGTGTNVFTGDVTIAGKLTAKGGLRVEPVEGQVTFDEWVDFSGDGPNPNYEPVRLWQDPVSKQTCISGVVRNEQPLKNGESVLLQAPKGFRPAKTNIACVAWLRIGDTVGINLFNFSVMLEIRANGKFVVHIEDLDPDSEIAPNTIMCILSGIQWSSNA